MELDHQFAAILGSNNGQIVDNERTHRRNARTSRHTVGGILRGHTHTHTYVYIYIYKHDIHIRNVPRPQPQDPQLRCLYDFP